MMEDRSSLDERNKLLTEWKAYCSKQYELSELTHLENDLQNLKQVRQNCKAEFLRIVEEQLVLEEAQKPPDDWLTMAAAETQLSESKESLVQAKILSEKTDGIKDIADVASDALNFLQEKLGILESKILNLEEKQTQLNGSPETSSKTMSGVQCCALKLSELLSSAQVERDIVRKSVQRIEDTLNSLEKLSSMQSRKVTVVRNELSRMEEKLKELETLSGMKCRLKGSTSIEIEFLSDDSFTQESSSSDGNVSAIPDDLRLVVTFTFRENEHKCLELEKVQTSQLIEKTDHLIRDVELDKDLTKLITELKKVWLTHLPLIKEISQIKCRHAVDWIQEKGLLLLIPRKCSSVVCTLKVPPTYPFSGEIVLESLTGHTSHVDSSDVLPPSNLSLMGWVEHLEGLFGKV